MARDPPLRASPILLWLFLADGPFEGRRYSGRRLADTLVMLGSPHTDLKATAMRARVARELPGARRLAPTAYRNSTGDPADRGDGLVPVESALLEGAEAVVLEGVAHGGAFGPVWYGTPPAARPEDQLRRNQPGAPENHSPRSSRRGSKVPSGPTSPRSIWARKRSSPSLGVP